MAIVVCGLSHKTVPLPVLEQVALTPDAVPKALARLLDHDPIHEGVIVSTCNRIEVYAAVHRFHPAVQAVRRFLSDVSGVGQDRIADGMYTHYDADAVRHLYEVASGVDSMVLGEPQILGQVREAFRLAAEEGTVRRMLHTVFQSALAVGKRVRTQTEISRHGVSLPQVGARAAAEIVGGLAGRRVLVIGAGRMGDLSARAALDAGAASLVVANRTIARAEGLITQIGGDAVGLDGLERAVADADVVISATSSDGYVLGADVLARGTRGRRVAVVDLGLPRDVDPAARTLDGVELRDIDDLREVAESNAQRRKAELPKVSAIVSEAVDAFLAWERSQAVGPAIEGLRRWAEEVRRDEVMRSSSGLDDAERERLERATRALVGRLLHQPMVRINELVQTDDGQVYLEAFREIFDLDPE